jgi:hypothetical protein
VILFLGLVFSAELLVSPLSAAEPKIVLQIGPNAVSQYAVEKNFARSQQQRPGNDGMPADAAQRWFELFLAKQVVIAEALAQGYDKRPEVTRIVETMERNMLSKENAPPDPATLLGESIPEEQLREIYKHTGVIPDVVGARLSISKAKELMGEKWSKASSPEKIEQLKALAEPASDCILYQGLLPWPREPFQEIENDLAAATADTWLEHKTPEATILVYIRSVQKRDLPPFEGQRTQFEKFVRLRQQQNTQRDRRAALLRAANTQVYGDVCAKLAESLKLLPPKIVDIPQSAIAAFAGEVLAKYQRDNEGVTITVEAWRDHYNHQILRRLPRVPMAVQENVQDMIGVDLAVTEARKQKLDQTPQFVEDRLNYLHYQALDLFEKEHLLPKIVVSDDEVKAHYEKHQANYSQVSRAHGVALRFETQEKAFEWLQQSRLSLENALTSPVILSKTEWDVSPEAPFVGLEGMTETLLRMPENRPIGPAPTPQGWIVFIKQSSIKAPISLTLVAGQVRSTLARDRLDKQELQLAREWARKFEVRDLVPYAKFGVPASLDKPWSKPTSI